MSAHFESPTVAEELLLRAMAGEQVGVLAMHARDMRWVLDALVKTAQGCMLSLPDNEGNLERIHDHIEKVVHIGGRERIVFVSGGVVGIYYDTPENLRGRRLDTIALAGFGRYNYMHLVDVTLTPSRQMISNPQLHGTTDTYRSINL